MKGLSKKQSLFIIALMETHTIAEAHNKAGISQTTAYNYLKNPKVKKAIKDMRADIMSGVTNKLMNSGTQAVDALMGVIKDKSAPHTAVVSASRTILEYLTRTYDMSEIMGRLERLEEQLNDE